MDNIVGGGPLPPPNELALFANVTHNRTAPAGSGAVRAFAGFGGQWDVAASGGGSQLATFSIELDFYTDPNWGKQSGTPADVIAYQKGGAFGYYVALDGSKLNPPLSVPLSASSPTKIAINWNSIIEHVIGEGLFAPPAGGWSNSSAATTAVFIGHEVQNTAAGTGGPMSDLFVSNFEEGQF
jgi:hypothetical protein